MARIINNIGGFPALVPEGSGRITNTDPIGVYPESTLSLPWLVDPKVSWIAYNCQLEVDLDSGKALHKTLPQSDPQADTLASIDINSTGFDTAKGGVSLESNNTQDSDIIQRMASSTYRFTLRGSGLRLGYQIPIPGLVSVGGNDAVPVYPQRGYNRIAGNWSGVPLFFAVWELHYVVTGPLSSGEGQIAPVPPNPAYHINADQQLPTTITLPWSVRDQSATTSPPPGG
jgi:hypothetical protein